jgi:hypothetical protein
MTKKKEIQTSVVASSVTDVVNRLNKKASSDIKALENFSIRTPDQYEEAAERVSRLKDLRKEADKQEKSITDPANLILKNTRAIFKPFKDRVDEVEMKIKDAMVSYIEARERKAGELVEGSHNKNIAKVVAKVNELTTNKSDHASVRKIVAVEITDIEMVPREYLVPDEAKIKAALQAGKKVKGCRLTQKTSIAI